MSSRIALVGLIALTSLVVTVGGARSAAAAAATELPKKLAELEAKQQANEAQRQNRGAPAAAAKRDKLLRKQLGKPPAKLITVRNGWTFESLPLDAKKGSRVDATTWTRFLRCHYTNQTPPGDMEIRLQDVLVGAALRFKKDRVDIVSGFRAPKYQLVLMKKGHEVARQSQHTEGNAVDFRLPGVPVKKLQSFVRSLHMGGVGIYLESQFVHADTGRIRFWAGR